MCTKEVYRCALSLIWQTNNLDLANNKYMFLNNIPKENIEILLHMLKNKINTHKTSSMGRFFDAISSIIGLNNFSKYESSSAILLEKIADTSISDSYPVDLVVENNLYKWKWITLVKEVLCDILKQKSTAYLREIKQQMKIAN